MDTERKPMHKDKKMIKRDILDKFRTMPEDADELPPNWLELVYYSTLEKSERAVFKRAVKELISKGLVEDVQVGSGNSLRLTPKGAHLIS